MDLLHSLITRSQEELAKTKALLDQSRQSRQQEQPETNMAGATAVMLPDQEVVLAYRDDPNHLAEQPARLGVITGALEEDDAEMELQDIEEFDLEHPYDPNSTAKFVPQQSTKGKPKPQGSFVPLASISSGSASKLQHMCDQRGIMPDFLYTEIAPERWTAKLELALEIFEITTICSSKKQAKEAVCMLALSGCSLLQGAPGVKRKSSSTLLPQDVDKSENWVGILADLSQKKKVAFAEYQESVNNIHPRQYKCTVSLLGGPETPFGVNIGHFLTKSAAKSSAAKEAVLWLRAQGIIREPPVKRPCPEFQHVTGLDKEELESAPIAVRLHNTVATMGFSQPRFDCHLSKTKLGGVQVGVPIYDAAVAFLDRDVAKEPKLAGAIGRVEQVHGQKKAKEACYEQVLSFLQQLQASRFE